MPLSYTLTSESSKPLSASHRLDMLTLPTTRLSEAVGRHIAAPMDGMGGDVVDLFGSRGARTNLDTHQGEICMLRAVRCVQLTAIANNLERAVDCKRLSYVVSCRVAVDKYMVPHDVAALMKRAVMRCSRLQSSPHIR